MLKYNERTIYFVLPICLVLLLCWYLFVPSTDDILPIEVIQEGYDVIELGEGISLRVDLIMLEPNYHTGRLNETFLHFVLLDKEGNEYYIPDVSTTLLEDQPNWTGSFIAEIDEKIVIGISSFDIYGDVQDSLGSKVTTVDENKYNDVAKEEYIASTRDGYSAYLCTPVHMQFIVLEDLPSDYELTCAEATLTAQQIQSRLTLLKSYQKLT